MGSSKRTKVSMNHDDGIIIADMDADTLRLMVARMRARVGHLVRALSEITRCNRVHRCLDCQEVAHLALKDDAALAALAAARKATGNDKQKGDER